MASTTKVMVRFRPQNSVEVRENGKINVILSDDKQSVHLEHSKGRQSFGFDSVFGIDSTQEEVFEASARPVVEDVMKGYNGTIFAYGQTGSGKTFSMQGPDIGDKRLKGIIPRIVDTIFTDISQASEALEFTVSVSYMEIYLEKIRDLLEPSQSNLPIHEDRVRGVHVKGLREVYVASADETMAVMQDGARNRVVSATNMNEQSSRSHALFLMTIAQRNTVDMSSRTGRLFLVDLAGSEIISKTGAEGQTLEEAKKINKSLSALGMVINALTDGKSTHVPYRDSKLTRILQESLGGNARTTLLINCSPSTYNENETLSTLRFGMRAKRIENRATVNQELSAAELKVRLAAALAEIASLQSFVSGLEGELAVWRAGDTVPESSRVHLPAVQADAAEVATISAAVKTTLSDGTPPMATKSDEHLAIENALQDDLAAAEARAEAETARADRLEAELEEARAAAREVKHLRSLVESAELAASKARYEITELELALESAQMARRVTETELTESRTELSRTQRLLAEATEAIETQRRKEKYESIMGDVENIQEALSSKETRLRRALDGGETAAADDQLEAELTRQREKGEELARQLNEARALTAQVEERHAKLEREYEALLDEVIAREESGAQDERAFMDKVRSSVESKLSEHKNEQLTEIERLRAQIAKLTEERDAARQTIHEQKSDYARLLGSSSTGNVIVDEQFRASMTSELETFKDMRESLLLDLQNRCKRVVELEMALDEARDNYQSAMRSNGLKKQHTDLQKLNQFAEQLQQLQRQLLLQNQTLRKERDVLERKLNGRNERLRSLELLLCDQREKSERDEQRFETELSLLRQQLSKRDQPQAGVSSRIIKPIRGGGTAALAQEEKRGGSASPSRGPNSSSSLPLSNAPAPPRGWSSLFSRKSSPADSHALNMSY